MRDIDSEPRPFPRIPGTISEKTLKVLIKNARIQGWHSLADEALQRAFIPRLDTVKFVLSEYARDGQRAIEEALREINFREYTPIGGGFDEEGLEEMQRAILQYELNKMRGERREVPYGRPTIHIYDPQEFVIGIGHTDAMLAPIFHKFSSRMIVHIMDNPDLKFDDNDAYDILRTLNPNFRGRVKDQIDILKENLDVMDTLFAFGKRIRFENGAYSVVPTRDPIIA